MPTDPKLRAPPGSWPCLTIPIDQGSDGWCAVNWMVWKAGLNVLQLFDPSHRVWNDCQNACKDSFYWASMVVLCVCRKRCVTFIKNAKVDTLGECHSQFRACGATKKLYVTDIK